MEKVIKEIIDEKIKNKEIIFTANILNIFLLKTEENILQEEAEEIEEKIEKYLINDERLIELFNGKYGEKEYIKEICKDVDENQYKSILENKYFCFFKELDTKEIKKLYQEEKIENKEKEEPKKELDENDIVLEKGGIVFKRVDMEEGKNEILLDIGDYNYDAC